MISGKKFILASGSPRRRELISRYIKDFEVICADADESIPTGTDARDAVKMLAGRKAHAVKGITGDKNLIILAADTVVAIDGEILGKPSDRADAVRMLKKLTGAVHEVCTGVCVISDGKEKCGVSVTKVRMRASDESEIQRYTDSGECDDKAGAYAVQGIGEVFVESIDGSYSGVVGLPLALTDSLLKEVCGEGLI